MSDVIMGEARLRRKSRTRRLSPWRVLLGIVLVGLLTAGGYGGWTLWNDSRAVASYNPWFAGYVDVTATPVYAFETPSIDEQKNVVLSFIVADTEDPCAPSWGTFYSLDAAAGDLDIDRRVARLTQQGGEVTVSFGGALNTELSTGCRDADALVDAYREVIDRYDVNTIDLDIEGDNLTNSKAGERRAAAMKALQDDRGASDGPIGIWLTLPIAPSGLTEDGLRTVSQMLEAGVDIAGVNAMTMDFGEARETNETMGETSIRALEALHNQLGHLYLEAGDTRTAAEVWSKIGATPMIGQNDVRGEIFGLDDAQALNAFAQQHQLGRMSMWSLNRDRTCGANFIDVTKVSDACSGVEQGEQFFAEILANRFRGQSTVAAAAVETPEPETTMEPEPEVVDDPITSPYVVWDEATVFPEETKVVWHGNVYIAKWWSTGDLPDDPALQSYDTPWSLLGPVLPTDTPRVQIVLPTGTYPEWSPNLVYVAGDRVMVGEVPYESKWWSQADTPLASLVNEDAGPWRLLTGDEVAEVLANLAEPAAPADPVEPADVSDPTVVPAAG